MAIKRKSKSDSITAQVESFQNSKLVVTPSIELDADELKIFYELLGARPLATWQESPTDVRTASTLARSLLMHERLMEQILKDGASIADENGKTRINPAFSAADILLRSIYASQRHLGLSASQRGLGLHDTKNQTGLEASSRRLINSIADDSLLA